MEKWDKNQYQYYREQGVYRVYMGLTNPMETKEGMEEQYRQHEQRAAGIAARRDEVVNGEYNRRDEKRAETKRKADAYFAAKAEREKTEKEKEE